VSTATATVQYIMIKILQK